MESTPAKPLPERIMSIDVLRGFDMFWIANGKSLFVALVLIVCGGTVPGWLDYHLEHPEWNGFSAWDMIMPLFLFIVGASMPFAFQRRKESGKGGARLYLKILRRVAILWVLGMIAQGHLLTFDISKLHFYSNTLQSIASGYLVASLVLLHLPLAGQIAVTAFLLLFYGLLMMFVPVPGHGAWLLTPDANLAMWVDKAVLGRFRDGTHYTWVLSSLGFSATVLLGVHAGQILLSPRTQMRKLYWLIGLGLACLAAGRVWGIWLPIIKHIWTSSMALWAAGWSFLLLAAFYAVVDMMGFRKWAFFFMIIGMNSIVAYMVPELINLNMFAGFLGAKTTGVLELALDMLSFVILWLVLYFMYRKRLFVRI